MENYHWASFHAKSKSEVKVYRGGVVAIAGIAVLEAAPGDLEIGTGAFKTLVRLAMICIFLRRAARRVRMLCTTTIVPLAQGRSETRD